MKSNDSIRVTAWFNRILELPGVKGVILDREKGITRMQTNLLVGKDDGRCFGAVAFPIANSLVPLSPDSWTMSAQAEEQFIEKDPQKPYRNFMISVDANGQTFEGNPEIETFEIEDRDHNKIKGWRGIKDRLAQVTAIWYLDENKDAVGKFYIDVFTLGAATVAKVKIYHQLTEWKFPSKLMSAIFSGNFPKKYWIKNLLEDNINHCYRPRNKREKETMLLLLSMVDPMATAYLKLWKQPAELDKLPASNTVSQVEQPKAPEATAPEASTPATEEPVPMPGADDEFEPPDLRAVPALTEEQQATAAQQVNPSRKGTGRTRKPTKGKRAKTGTDGK